MVRTGVLILVDRHVTQDLAVDGNLPQHVANDKAVHVDQRRGLLDVIGLDGEVIGVGKIAGDLIWLDPGWGGGGLGGCPAASPQQQGRYDHGGQQI